MSTLIKFNKNWADEFDCQQFLIIDQSIDELNAVLDKFLSTEDNDIYFGSNQELSNFRKENFKFTKISTEEEEVILKHLSSNFGLGVLTEIFIHKDWLEEDE